MNACKATPGDAAEYDKRFRQLYAAELAKEGLGDIDPWAVVDRRARFAAEGTETA